MPTATNTPSRSRESAVRTSQICLDQERLSSMLGSREEQAAEETALAQMTRDDATELGRFFDEIGFTGR